MREFRVVTHKNWVANAFMQFGGVQDFGLDIDPVRAHDTLWWAPGQFITRAQAAGVFPPVLSPGPRFLNELPMRFTRRVIVNCRQSETDVTSRATPTKVFAKLPEAKIDRIPARLYLGGPELRDSLRAHGLPDSTVWQLSEEVDFTVEARYFIAHGEVVASSLYRVRDVYVDGDPDFWTAVVLQAIQAGGVHEMNGLAARVAHWGYHTKSAPPGYVLDVGMTKDRGPVVVEANASWSSALYDADPVGVYQSLLAAHDFEGKWHRFRFDVREAYGSIHPLKLRGTPLHRSS